jgi:hypothetical protein
MTITCTRFNTQVLPDGRIQLQLDGAEPTGDTTLAYDRMTIPEIATMFGVTPTTIYRLSTRKIDPLPLVRGRGRPYGFRSKIRAWLDGSQQLPRARVFGA